MLFPMWIGSFAMIAPRQKPLKPMKMSELSEHGQMALRAMRRAARKLRAEHKRLGLPLMVWKTARSSRNSRERLRAPQLRFSSH